MVRLLITCGESSKDQYVLVRDLIEATTLQADPICVLLDPQVERLPVLAPLNVILLNQVGPLPAIEACNNVQCLAVKGDCRVEVPASVQAGDLGPCVTGDIIDLTLVHRLTRQGASNSVYPGTTPPGKHTRQRMGSPLEDHVSPLLQPLVDELIAAFSGLARLTASCQEDPALLILYGHEIGWDFDIDHVAAVRVRAEVVHE